MRTKEKISSWLSALSAILLAVCFSAACSSTDDIVEPAVLKPGDVVTDFKRTTSYEGSKQFQDDLDAFNRYAFAVRALRWDYWMLASDGLKNPEDFFTVAPEELGKNDPAALEKYFDMLEKVCDSLDIYQAAMENLENNGILATSAETRGILSDGIGFGIACKSSAAMGRQAVMGILRAGGWSTDMHMLTELYKSLPDERRRGYSDAVTFWQDFSAGKLDNRSNLIFKDLYDMPGSVDAVDFREKCKEIGISPSTNVAVIGQKLAESGLNLIIDACPIDISKGVDIFNTVEAQHKVMFNSLKFKEDGTYDGINTEVWKEWAKVWGHNAANYGRNFQKFLDKAQVDFQSEFYTNWDEAKDWWIDNVFKDTYDFSANEVLFSDNLREACDDHGKSLGLTTLLRIKEIDGRPYEFVYLVDPATGKIRLGFVKDDNGNVVMFPGPDPTTRVVTVVNRQTGKRTTKTIVVKEGEETEEEVDLEFDEKLLEENPANGELTLKPSTSFEDKTGEGGYQRFTIVTNYLYYTYKTEDKWVTASIPSDANFLYVKLAKNDTGKERMGKVIVAATDSKGKVLKTVTLNITQQPYIEEENSIKAIPSSLVFDGKGGKLESSVSYPSGALYTGIDYDDELAGWLKISTKDVYGGSYTLVAEADPNGTGKERSGTITLFAAYNPEAIENAMHGNVDKKLVYATTILVKQAVGDVKPTFVPRTDIKYLKIFWRVRTTGGNWYSDDSNFITGEVIDYVSGGVNPIKVTKSANMLHVSGTKTGSLYKGYRCDITYSFNIKYSDEGVAEVTDLELKYDGVGSSNNFENPEQYKMDGTLKASNILVDRYNEYSDGDVFAGWDANEEEGLTISHFNLEYDVDSYYPGETPSMRKERTSLIYESNPTNRIYIDIQFGE